MSLIFIVAVAVVGWVLYQKYYQVLLNQGKAGKIKLALIVLGLIFLVLAVTGRAPALFAVLGAAMTQVMRFAPLWLKFMPSIKKAYTGSAGGGGANVSQVVTNTLKMSLDHASGRMDGEVLAGPLAGRQIQSLSMVELTQLYQYCQQNDPEAGRLLMSFISRERADAWESAGNRNTDQSESSQGPAGGSSAMDRNEALAILGLEEPFTRQDVTQAHRSLMGKFHPDKGGNTYLATKLNNARDLLIESIKET